MNQLNVQEGATEAASALMTWAPHQERSPHTIDGNETKNRQLERQLISMVQHLIARWLKAFITLTSFYAIHLTIVS